MSTSPPSDPELGALEPSLTLPALGRRLALAVLLCCSLAVGLTEWLNRLPPQRPSPTQGVAGVTGLGGVREIVFEPSSAGQASTALAQAQPWPESLAAQLARDAALVLLLSLSLTWLLKRLILRPLRQLQGQTQALASGLQSERQQAELLRRRADEQGLALQEVQQALAQKSRELSELSRIDALTGLANRREFEEVLRREFKRAQRLRGRLTLAVLDLDQFKNFNERYGQAAGDAVLQRFARLLFERFKRDTDMVARLGGEEFVALLPGFELETSQYLLEQLREDLLALQIKHEGGVGEARVLSVSIGVAAYGPTQPYLSSQALMQAADEALTIAKHAGRDRLSRAERS